MLRFLRALWDALTALKNATFNLLFLAIVIAILVAVLSTETITVPESAALIVDPSGIIVEQKRAIDPVAQLFANYEEPPESLHRDLLAAIEAGAEDDRIKALVLDLHAVIGVPMSLLQELGNAVTAFKASGKPVYAFGPGYTQAQYYLAAHADRVFIDKHAFQSLGGVFLTGFGVYPTYLKTAIDKLKVRFHVFKAGEYKSAVEPFTRDDMSEAAREANREWIGGLWDEYTDTVVEQRGIDVQSFEHYTNAYDEVLGESGNDPTQLAIDRGLVDGLLSGEEFASMLRDLVGGEAHDYSSIRYRDYLAVTRPPIPVVNPAKDKIAVITAKGTILDGDQPAGNIGAESLTRLISQAREDDTVKALVMRIDSPGGSASAAEKIRAELQLTRERGKPVVVSMSAYAASGGYWVSATANKIFAMPTTVTGSIGTFLVFPTFSESLAELGIYTDGVGTTELSGALDPFRPLNPVLEHTLERTVAHTYNRFLSIVAQGRDMTVEQVDAIARGRVWTGKKAMELGLVDAMGTLDDAVESAALLADVSDYEVLYLEKSLTTRERLVSELLSDTATRVRLATRHMTRGVTMLQRLPEDVRALVDMSASPGVYLRCIACRVVP